MSQRTEQGTEHYHSGAAQQSQIAKRHRTGSLGRTLFLMATALAIIVLIVLLLNIINQSFGLTAVQSEVPPDVLVQQYSIEQILSAPNVETGEDDQQLANNIGSVANSVGFFGFAFYINNNDQLKALSLDGIELSAETANSGQYPLTRPLYIYTTPDILAAKPQVATYISYYLDNLNQAVETVGYFPIDDEIMAESRLAFETALSESGLKTTSPAGASGNIGMAGSSTVFPISKLLAEEFKVEGFQDNIDIGSIGTTGGFNLFCQEALPDIDIVNASRPVSQLESEACHASGRDLVEIRIGTDALAVVVNKDVDFIDEVSKEQLQNIFTDSVLWSDVNAAWPEEPISRFVPGRDSGTMNFFVDQVLDANLDSLPKPVLVAILQERISRGLGRRLERDQRFFADQLVFEDPALWEEVCASQEPPAGCTLPARDQGDIVLLVQERVVVPTVVEAWFLFDSVFNRQEITREAAEKYPNAELEFRSWMSGDFVSSPQSSKPEIAGVRTALLGTLWVITITMMVAFPLGVGAAIYLEEYADQGKWYNRVIQTNINNLAGVPSIIYGMLGLVIFVRALEPITSGAAFGAVDAGTTANGRTVLAAGLTLALLILPIIIISSQESIRAVPGSLRRASLALGATRWQTIWNHVLPNALPGILTGTILSMSRAIGETAPLVVIGASTFITADPTGPFSKFTVLPIQIFQWTTRPQSVFRNIAAAAIIVLLILLVLLNATAVYLRNRSAKQQG